MDKETVAEAVSDIIAEYLEILTHTVLYIRDVYPRNCFKIHKFYNSPVQICMHPGVIAYIKEVQSALKELLFHRQLQDYVVVILDERNQPIERFVFEIGHTRAVDFNKDHLLMEAENQLRNLCMKVQLNDLKAIKPASFTINLHTGDAAVSTIEKLDKEIQWRETAADTSSNFHIVPLSSVETVMFKMQAYVEQPVALAMLSSMRK